MVICVKVDNYHSEGMQYSLDRHQPILTCCVGPTVSVTSAMIDYLREWNWGRNQQVCLCGFGSYGDDIPHCCGGEFHSNYQSQIPHHLSWVLNRYWSNEIADVSVQSKLPATDTSHWKKPVGMIMASDKDASWELSLEVFLAHPTWR